MASKFSLATTVIVLAALLHTTAAQETHVVGDGLGWIVPPGGPVAYETWAALQIFTAGDILVFNFKTGEQDVARVTKEAFDSCNSTNPIELKTTGPANFTLSWGGEYYFIGTMDRRCSLGQKLAINVSGSSGPIPSPVPSAPAPSVPRTPVTYFVGDDLGWIVPPGGEIAYATWAYGKSFMVGDTLVFNFTTGQQDVARVTKEAFDACNSTNPIALMTTGPAVLTLSSVGEYYFIGTMDRRCSLGQKLAINVTASPGPTASPAPIPPPATPAPTPPRAPATYVVGDNLGWLVPPGGEIAYASWAYSKTFIVGDTLVFNFENGRQDVAVVNKSTYESCNTTNNTINVYTTSPAMYSLNTAGEHYFTSTYPRHCLLGQKLAIRVIPAPGSAAPTPSASPGMPPSLSYGPSAGGPSAQSFNSAPSLAAGVFYGTVLSIAVAIFFN